MPKEKMFKQRRKKWWLTLTLLCCNQQDVSPWGSEEGQKHPELGFVSVNKVIWSVGQLLRPPWLIQGFIPHLSQTKSVSRSLPMPPTRCLHLAHTYRPHFQSQPVTLLTTTTSGSLLQMVSNFSPNAELKSTLVNSGRKKFIQVSGKYKYSFSELPSLKL